MLSEQNLTLMNFSRNKKGHRLQKNVVLGIMLLESNQEGGILRFFPQQCVKTPEMALSKRFGSDNTRGESQTRTLGEALTATSASSGGQ